MLLQFANSQHQTALLLLLQLMSTMTVESIAVQGSGQPASSVIRIDCRLYRRAGPVQPVLLDCRPDVAAHYAQQAYAFRRQAMLLMPPTTGQNGRRWPVWRLDETTLVKSGDTDINILPREAFTNLAETVSARHLFLLRRLRQRRLDLSALAGLPQLRHLEVTESNATCLTRDMFDSAPRLVSLRLVDNNRLSCMQPDTLSDLTDLTELSILGSPRLKSLNAAAAAPSLTDLRLANLQPSWSGTLCRARSLRRLCIDRLPQNPLILAGLTGLQSLQIDVQNDEMLMTLMKLAPAVCAQWPDGRLQLNRISLANWTLAHVLQDFAEFCEFEPETDSFAERARQLCNSAAHQATEDCFAECRGDGRMPKAQALSTSPSLFMTASPSPAATDDDDLTESQNTGGVNVIKNYGGWRVDQRGVLGTALLTAGAFLGGVLAAAYCCNSSRLSGGGLKPSITESAASGGSGGVATVFISGSSGGSDRPALEEDEPIRLIGYSAKSNASLPALERPPPGPLIWTD